MNEAPHKETISHRDMYEKCMSALDRIYANTGMVALYQDEADAPLTDAQFDRLKEEIEKSYTKSPLLLEGGLKISTVDMAQQIMPLLEAAKYHLEQMTNTSHLNS